MSAVSFDPTQKLIVLRLRTSFYALRILPDGQVVHVGSGPAPEGNAPMVLGNLDAYEDPNYVWDEGGRRYELPTYGDIAYHHVGLKVSFPEAAAPLGKQDANHLPVRDLRLRYLKHEIRTDAAPAYPPAHGKPARKSGVPRETLILHLRDIAYNFEVRLCYRITPELDVIERWIELHNLTKMHVTIESLAFGTVHFPQGTYELTRTAGSWSREFIPVRQNIEQGETVLSQFGINTGHAFNPFYLVSPRGKTTEHAGEVYFGALAFSGNWALRFEALPTDAVRVYGGYEPTGFGMVLAPGESHTTPAFVHGYAGDGFGGASRRLHAFTRDYILPGFDDGQCRPVLYNSWEATFFKLSVDGQIQLARSAAEMGVELFCMDDGWFGDRRNDHAGLGDWIVSKAVFPDGLQPLVDEVKRLGMRFGLWVEPEMVNPDSDLYRKHPDWVLHYPGRPRTEMRFQLILDFGRPEVVEYIYNALAALLQTYDISFFKWDMNRYATEPGSVAGSAIWQKHVEGLYGIMDRLRKNFPKLDIQSCSGGGGRVDLGILARCDQAWTSDNTDAQDRTYIEDGFSLAYPPRVMESWVTHEHNLHHASLDLRFDVAMRGALGIGTKIDQLSAEERVHYKRKITFYKKIRPVVQNGNLYRLAMVQDGGASVWQSVTPDGSQCVYSVVVIHQLQGHHLPTYRLKALQPGAIYRITDETGAELARYSGSQLMGLGIHGDSRFGGAGCAVRSRTLLLERVS